MKVYSYIGDVDRAFEYAIEKELTRIGWYPDKDACLASGNSSSFFAEIEALKASNTFAQVFGVGNYKDRKEQVRNHIIIDRGSQSPSDANFTQGEAAYVEKEDEAGAYYERYRLAETPEDVNYRITLICDSSKVERKLTTAIYNALGYRKQLSLVDDQRVVSDNTFLAVRTFVADTSGTDYIEKQFQYSARDLVILEEVLEEARIAKINEFTIELAPDTAPTTESTGVEVDTPID